MSVRPKAQGDATIRRYLAENGLDLPVYQDGGGAAADALNITTIVCTSHRDPLTPPIIPAQPVIHAQAGMTVSTSLDDKMTSSIIHQCPCSPCFPPSRRLSP